MTVLRQTLTGDQPMSAFDTDDEAYEYAFNQGACVYDRSYQCVYCFRHDH